MKSVIKIAVRELVEFVCRTGDLEFEFSGSRRSIDAIRAHQRIQKSRPDSYHPEVPVTYRHETEEFIIQIGGRIDGVYTLGAESSIQNQVVIDEIKTTGRGLEHFENSENEMHWGQAKCYAFMYAAQNDLKEIGIQLTYFQMDSGEIREYRRTFTFDDLAQFFQSIINRYLEWAETITRWCRLRDESIRVLQFPFEFYRPGQRKMAVEIYRTIDAGGQLIVQATTGIGKTMAAIFPAVKSIAEGLTTKIFYLTARTTGRTVAEKAIEELRAGGLRLKSLTLTAKDKICFHPEKSCSGDECEFARGYYERLSGALSQIFLQDALTREYIEEIAGTHRLCPFELSLELSLYADCIICDYNYAFDPRVYLRRFFLEGNGDYTFLIDEAHNLVDRSREMFSADIRKQPFLDLRRKVRNTLPQVYKSMGRINTWLVKARKKCAASGDRLAEKMQPEGLYPALRGFLKVTEDWLSLNKKTTFREALLDLYFTVAGFVRVAENYDESYVTCYERVAKDLRLKLFCIDPSGQLREALNRCRAAIFYSATMTPAAYFKKIFGCRDLAGHLILPSPFPAENLGLFVSDRISTLYRQREMTAPAVTGAVAALVQQKRGNYLLFFPSYEYMLMIHDAFKAGSPDIDTILQTREMGEPERIAFLSKFSLDPSDTLVGFAVMGGIFGEGIDLVGDRLNAAAIVGVGLPGISLERELIREYFSQSHNAGFEFAYLYPGINRVLQAAGRVIRSENERGVVLLIDQRFGIHRYRSLLPREWIPTRVHNEQQLREYLSRFWG